MPELNYPPHNLPINVLAAIRQNLGADDGEDTAWDYLIESMSAKELFRSYCEWEGFIGWADALIFAWEKIQEAKALPYVRSWEKEK